jgi:hypothetical protein
MSEEAALEQFVINNDHNESLCSPVVVLRYQKKHLLGLVSIRYRIEDLKPELFESTVIDRFGYSMVVKIFGREVFNLAGRLNELPEDVDVI